MIDQNRQCDDEQLRQMLRQESESCDCGELLDHVEGCAHCQHRLDELAADEAEWLKTIEVLSSSARDSVNGDAVLNTSHFQLQQYAWTESMAQKLLLPPMHPELLGRIGRYDVERLIGSGGMGVVFKAYDTELNRPVAVKLLAPYLASSGSARNRFAREARAAAAVVDDHVVPIHNVETDNEHPFLVMKYIAGGSLQLRLDRDGRLDVCEVLRIGMQTATGLAAAHAQGLIHRDVKPSNILLDEGVDRALLTDFGLARATDDASLTRSGFHPGTPHYMSPEQVRGEAIDARSDLFGLGCVLYALCTGHPPFRSKTSYAVLRRITDDTPRPIRETNPDVPAWMEQIVMKLLAKSPADRFASAEQVAEHLKDCLAHVQSPTTNELPTPVAKLVKSFGVGRDSNTAESLDDFRYPPITKLIAAAAFAFALIFAGVLIVLETNKGTLTIESEADDVPIRIMRGDNVVKTLVVDREGTTTRLHAGHYTLQVDDPNARYDVSKNQVIVKRGDAHVAKITFRPTDNVSTIPVTQPRHIAEAIREFNNLHPADASGKPQPPLTQGELYAVLAWKKGNGELSDELVLALRSSGRTRDRAFPAGWRFTGGLVYEPCPDGAVQTWQIRLQTNGLTKPISIRRSAIAPPPLVRKPTKVPDEGEAGVSLSSMIETFNIAHPEMEQRGALPHELPPLTLNEVLAAIELSRAEHEQSDAKGLTSEVLQRIVATHHLPTDSRIELVTEIKNAIDQWFTVESIRIVVPRPDDPQTTDAIKVRHQFVETDGNHPQATHWSKPGPSGLQAGVRLAPAQLTYQHGDVVDIEFLYRSAISQKIAATLPSTFQFGKVRGVRLERVSFVRPKWPDGSVHALVGNEPLVVRGHRMQICFDSKEATKPGVNLKAITRPKASHYVRFTVPNPTDDKTDETLEISHRLFFRIAPLTPPKVPPLYESHYYQHWGVSVPGHRRPEHSTPDPEYIDPFQIGVSLGPADKSRIPAYYASGLQVTKVTPYSPAENVGIEVGDILLTWEGNQVYGDDPNKPFANYDSLNNRLREELERNAKCRGWGSGNTKFDLLDHRTGEVIRIAPWFGRTAGGSPNKAEVIRRMTERKKLREQTTMQE